MQLRKARFTLLPGLPGLSLLTCKEDVAWRNLYPLALGMMALPLWCILVAVFGFIVWIPMTKYHLIIAFTLTLGTMAWGCRWDLKKSIVQGLLFAVVALLCAVYASLFLDRSRYDGPAYHKPPVIEMKNGWNPIWEYNSARDQGHETYWDWSLDRWWFQTKHFPKADWYINAVFYAFSGNLDLGHLTRVFYVFVTFIVVFAAITSIFHLPNYQSFFLSLIAAWNPYAVYQIFSGYLDGALGSCLTILFFAFAAYLKNKDKRFLPFVVASIVIAVNLKFTGAVYVAVFLICMLIPSVVSAWALRTLRLKNKKNKSEGEGRKEHLCIDRTLTGSLVLATVLALIVGINPYLYHLYHHYTPFYPLHTVRSVDKADNVDFMKTLTEDYVGDANRVQQFIFQYLLTSDNDKVMPDNRESKEHGVHTITVSRIPFGPGNNLSRFGNFFLIPMWFSLFMMPLIRRKEVWFLLIAVWVTIWIQPHIWYARYIPHLWVVPVIVAGAVLSQFNTSPEYRRRFVAIVGIVLMCMLINAIAFTGKALPRVELLGNGITAHFVKENPHSLFFDTPNGLPHAQFRYSTETYISDWLPGYSFEHSDRSDASRIRLTEFLSTLCPVYLVAEDQEELDRLANIKPSHIEMTQAILYLRWQQFKRAWGAGK